MTQKKPKQVLSYTLLGIACICLINPMPLLLDLIPDVIGYLVMIYAISKIANMVGEFDQVKDTLSKLALITALKIPAFFIMTAIWGGDITQRSIVAVFTLVFSVVECCFLIPLIHELFVAFGRLGEFHGISSALSAGEGAFAMRPEMLEKLTLTFFLVRAVLSCLPEMALVPMIEANEGGGINWNVLYPIFALVGALITLVLGIIWYCYFLAYLKRMKGEREANQALTDRYEENPIALTRGKYRRIRTTGILYIIGVVCSFDITIDNINFLPDIFTALCLLASSVMLCALLRRGYATLVVTGLYAVATSVQTILTTRFFARYDVADIKYFDVANAAYQKVLWATFIGECLLIATVAVYCVYFAHLVTKTIGEEDMTHRPVALKTRKEIRRKFLIATIFGALTAATSYFWRLTYLETKNLPSSTVGYITVPALDWFWVVPWITGALWLGWSVYAFNRLREEAELDLPET